MKKVASVLVLVLGFGSSSASLMAGAVGAGTNAGIVDLVGIKAKCNELLQNEQLKPFKALVSCSQVSMEWRPSRSLVSEPVQVANAKSIGASFQMKGYQVPFASENVPVAPALASCTTLEQVKITVPAVDLELECAALDQVQTLTDLCAPAIDARVGADPSIQIEEPTGQTFNTCDR